MKPSPEAIESADRIQIIVSDHIGGSLSRENRRIAEEVQTAIDASTKELRQDVEEMNNYVKQAAEKLQSRPAQESKGWRITEAGEPPDAGWYLHLGCGEPLLFNSAQLEKLEAISEKSLNDCE